MMLISNQAEIYIKEIKFNLFILGFTRFNTICCTVVRSHKGKKSRSVWLKKLQRWKSSINIDLRKWVFSSSLFFFLGCFVFGPQLMMIMQHPPFTYLLTYYLLNKGNVMQTARSQNCNFWKSSKISKGYFSFFLSHLQKKSHRKKLSTLKEFWTACSVDLAFWFSIFPNRKHLKQTHKLKWVSRTVKQDK